MTWQPLESKLLTSAAYDPERCILYLRFQSADVYRYFAFPPSNTGSSSMPGPEAATSLPTSGTTSGTSDLPDFKRRVLFVRRK